MIGAVVGIAVGILLALFVDINIPPAYSLYMAVAVLAAMDCVVGAIVSISRKRFNMKIFITGLIFNGFVSAAMVYIGKLIGIELSLAPILLFGVRILKKFSIFRRFLLNKYKKRGTIYTEVLNDEKNKFR